METHGNPGNGVNKNNCVYAMVTPITFESRFKESPLTNAHSLAGDSDTCNVLGTESFAACEVDNDRHSSGETLLAH